MNIVHLIGNGFDIKLGLRTKYRQFYEWLVAKKEPSDLNPAVALFREKIDQYVSKTEDADNEEINWSDLERAIGKFLKLVKSDDDAVELIRYIQNRLQEYIRLQNDEASMMLTDQKENETFLNSLFFPDSFFRKASRDRIYKYTGFWNAEIDARVMVFNYTSTFERLIGWENAEIRFQMPDNVRKRLQSIEHIHGYCDREESRLAIGLDSEEQIDNEELAKSLKVLRRYIKQTFNDCYEIGHSEMCEGWISRANVICLYGLSLGETDQRWWNAIGKHMRNSSSCLLFCHVYRDMRLTGNSGPDYQDQIDEDTDFVINRLGLTDSRDIPSRIFVSYSEDIFHTGISMEHF